MPEEAREAEHAARLLAFLRDLARARRRPSRDLADHDHVHWLAGLPGDVYVEADAGPGDVLFSVPVIPLTPPVVLDEFDGWLALRNWYRILRELSDQEVVLATGLLSWRPAVHDHLLSTPVRIVVDDRTERIDVVLAGRTSLRDRELLSGHPGFRPAGWVADAVQAGQGFGLNASVGDVLRKWCQVALTGPADYREDWTPDTDTASPAPRIRLAPALVVRPPGRAAIADHHARLLTLLPRGVPDGLARLVSPSEKPQVMHIPERTPETVPDLLGGLLARGHRVLVATSGPAASAALRAALPPALAGLAATDAATGAQVADAIRAAEPDVEPAAERERAAARRVAELTERLDDEPGEPPPDRRAEAPELSWMPVRPDMPPTPPISRSEAAELVVLLAEESAERKARTAQRDVDPGALPSAAYVSTLIDAEIAAAERAERSRTDLSQLLRDSDVTLLARLDGDASVVSAALRDLGLDGHPGGWNPADLAVRALSDALADRRPLIWSRVVEMTSRAQWAERALAELGSHAIELPADADLRGLAAAAQDLRDHLAGGGTLKRGPLRSAAQRQAEPLLATVTVDGAAPTTPELLDLVHTDLMVRITCRELQYVWEAAGISFPADLPPAERIARFVRAHARLARVRDAMPAVDSTRRLLERNGIGVPLGHPVQWHAYATALRNALEGLGVSRATADLDALRDSIGPVGPDDPPELAAAVAAIDARDAAAYGRALGGLAEARHELSLQIRCQELIARVRAVHPDLANLMIATDGDEAWQARTRRWDDAWAWARVAAAAPPPADRARADLAAAEEELTAARAALTAARAWAAAVELADVPAWILPLWRIPDVLPPAPGSFDAVIVDGEHEAGAEALYILWLAPRAILVGPAGPDLPAPEGPPPTSRLPSHLHEAITPTTSLFTALTAPRRAEPEPDPPRETRPAPNPMFERPDRTQRDLPATRPSPAPPPPRRPAPPHDRPPMTGRDPRPAERPATPAERPATSPERPATSPERQAARGERPNNPPARPGVPPERPGNPPAHRGTPAERQAASPERPNDPPARPGTPAGRPSTWAERQGIPTEPPGTPPERQSTPPARPGSPPARPGGPVPEARPRSERPDLTQRDVEVPPPAARPTAPQAGPGAPQERRAPRRPESGVPARPPAEPPQPRRAGGVEQPGRPPERRPGSANAPPRRLDAPRLEPREGGPQHPGPRGPALPPRRLDAAGREEHLDEPEVRRGDVPPRRPGAAGQDSRAPEAERRPPAAPSDIPALWGKPGPRPQPPAPREAPAETAHVKRGQSIVGYKRPELVKIVGQIAEREPDLTDEQIVELVTRLLACPEDEALLVGARLRYAVEMYREQSRD
ncbi:hypothetical protein [Actinomadura monticuli]|uniref:Uncharacterized protein n=1 Tax=Actinomadura monticuli TaxID=3097367 RepID=A0ABV4QAT6_9ACTN